MITGYEEPNSLTYKLTQPIIDSSIVVWFSKHLVRLSCSITGQTEYQVLQLK